MPPDGGWYGQRIAGLASTGGLPSIAVCRRAWLYQVRRRADGDLGLGGCCRLMACGCCWNSALPTASLATSTDSLPRPERNVTGVRVPAWPDQAVPRPEFCASVREGVGTVPGLMAGFAVSLGADGVDQRMPAVLVALMVRSLSVVHRRLEIG